MDGRTIQACALFACLLLPLPASAAVVEISAMVGYNTAQFNDGYRSVQRRYTGTLGFKFTAVSAIEFEYTDATTIVSYNTQLSNLLARPTRQESTQKDQIYSFNWVQNLVSSKWIIQPYFLLGGGRMTRVYKVGLPEFGFEQVTTQKVTQGTGGVGIRIFLTRSMAIKTELKSYVPNFQFDKWKENQLLSAGVSFAF